MIPEITLTLRRPGAADERIAVRAPSFTIGRDPGNDLVLKDAGLSRRHALITSLGDAVQITDCGSRNGTLVNGRLIGGATELRDGDVIELGEDCQLIVSFVCPPAADDGIAPRRAVPDESPPAAAQLAMPPAGATKPATAQRGPLLAVAAIVLILFVTILAVIVSQIGSDKSETKNERSALTSTPVEQTVESTVEPAQDDQPTLSPNTRDVIERAAVRVMRGISNDRNYQFPPSALDEIRRAVERYRASGALAGALRALDARGSEISSQARREGIRPALLLLLALAATDGGERGDPVAAARQLLPTLLVLWPTFGSETADSSLIIVAASRIPGGTAKSHPLLATMRRVVNNSQTERNVWFLRERGALDPEVYNFVIRFLALGVIAENPPQFGLDAPALAY